MAITEIQRRFARDAQDLGPDPAATIAGYGTDPEAILSSPGSRLTLTADLTLPAWMSLESKGGGLFETAGNTLTIHGPVKSDAKIFDAAPGEVVLGKGVKDVELVWWMGTPGEIEEANFYDDASQSWYSDALFTTPATDTWPFLKAAILAAAGRRVILPEGRFYANNAGVDNKTPYVFDGVSVHLVGRGAVRLMPKVVALPTVTPGTSNPVSRHILKAVNAELVRVENVVFDGGDTLVGNFSGQADVDRTYRAAMLEARDCGRVILEDTFFTRHRPVYSPENHGTVGEDPTEAWNVGPLFVRGCTLFQSRGGGIEGETRNEGWMIHECGTIDSDQFYSEASLIYTPFNAWSPGAEITFKGTIKNAPGSSAGLGGQGANIRAVVTLENSGGVNLTRTISSETSGWKTADIEVNGSGLYESSHGFAVKAGMNLARTFDAVLGEFVHPYGHLRVRGAIDGCLGGVWAQYCESVDVDMTVRDPVDVLAYAGGHDGLRGHGLWIGHCNVVKLRGLVDAMRPVLVDAVSSSPVSAVEVIDCVHLDHDVTVLGEACTGTAVLAYPTIDYKAANGTRYFKTLRFGGSLHRCAGTLGTATEKLGVVTLVDSIRSTNTTGARLVSGNDVGILAYMILPPPPTTLARSTNLSIPNATDTSIVFTSVASGFSDDWNGTSAFLPRQRGKYRISFQIALASLPANTPYLVNITKNGAAHRGPVVQGVTGGAAGVLVLSGSVEMELNGSTDFARVSVRQDSGAAVNVTSAYLTATYEGYA